MVKNISEVNIECGNRRMEDVMLNYEGRDKTFYSATEGSTKFHLILFGIENPPIKHPQIDVFIAKNSLTKKQYLFAQMDTSHSKILPLLKNFLTTKSKSFFK